MLSVRQRIIYFLCFLFLSAGTALEAKSVLLKNGRRITNVDVKPIANGFELTYKGGRKETISLSEVQKIFISNNFPTKFNTKSELQPNPISGQKEKEIPKDPREEEKAVSFSAKPKSGVAVFAEGLIPGWSRLARNDSYSLKSLGFFLMFMELFLAYESYIYLSPVQSLPKSSVRIQPSAIEIAAFLSRDPNLTNNVLLNRFYWESSKLVLSNGQLMQKGLYREQQRMYVSAFVFVLILDAFLGYKFEDWSVVPSLNVSFREKEVSGGIIVRF